MKRIIYKHYFRCATQDTPITGLFGSELKLVANTITFNGLRNSDGTYSAAPAWFTQVNGFPVTDTFWIMTPPSESNTNYSFSWTVEYKDQTEAELLVNLSMLDYCETVLGCDTPTTRKPLTMLLWLNREGGYDFFPFNGRKSFEVTIPDAGKYIDVERVQRNNQRKGVYNGEILTTGDIPEISLDLLQSLKESIQVYLVENPLEVGEQIYHPVILQDGDFTKRKTGDKRFDVTVRLYYSTERQIQTQ